MADLGQIKATLTDIEATILPLVKKQPVLSGIIAEHKLDPVVAMRGVQWLENKNLILAQKKEAKSIVLDKNGLLYHKQGLPETRFLHAIKHKPKTQAEIMKSAKLSNEELGVSLGLLKKRQAIEISKKGKFLLVSITKQGKDLLKRGSLEQQLIEKKFPIALESLAPEFQHAVEELKKRRKIIRIQETKDRTMKLTALGEELLQQGISAKKTAGRLTPSMLKTGTWKKETFRAYDLDASVPSIRRGRMHFENEAIRYVKRIWLDMGFTEMTGDHVQTAFWDLDVLFVPQDHPAREEQDTFYLKDPKTKTVEKDLTKTIKEIHETGGRTKSTGWGGSWDPSIAEQLLLRTHTTVLSALTLKGLKTFPAKFFNVGKVYRNEALDWKHLFEFYQVDGIVVDENANLQHLKGYLSQFYKKMGFSDVRMRPAHFPYTEPSVEIEAFHPVKNEWIELGGAGIFRPEVVIPLLGKDIPVLAWGLGLPRIIARYYDINDIREIYHNDINQLMEMRTWLK